MVARLIQAEKELKSYFKYIYSDYLPEGGNERRGGRFGVSGMINPGEENGGFSSSTCDGAKVARVGG
jgi:hypothetical protein